MSSYKVQIRRHKNTFNEKMAPMWVTFTSYRAVFEAGSRHSEVAKDPDRASWPLPFVFVK